MGDPREVSSLAGTQRSAAVGELLIGGQPGLDPLASSTSCSAFGSGTLPICLR
jgi:hypothetical protein